MGDDKKVISFPGKTVEQTIRENRDHIISILEGALALVREGEVEALAVCWVNRDGSTSENFANYFRAHQLMAAITYLQVNYAAEQIDQGKRETDD